jgi:2-iminobutanoate/2-iminopropanoate deaminase
MTVLRTSLGTLKRVFYFAEIESTYVIALEGRAKISSTLRRTCYQVTFEAKPLSRECLKSRFPWWRYIYFCIGETFKRGEKLMRSTSRLITILCSGLLFTCAAEAQQPSKPRPPVPSTGRSAPAPPRVEYLKSDPARPAPFSDAVRVDHMLYLTGQLGTDGPSGLVSGGIKAETKQAMENIRRVLERNGSSLDQIVKCTVMLADINDRSAMSEVYVTYFAKDRMPARSAFGVSGLALGARVEIECLATIR